MKKKFIFLWLSLQSIVWSQNSFEKYPTFTACENSNEDAKNCFYNTLKSEIQKRFVLPQLSQNNSNNYVYTLFEIDTVGAYKILYIEASNNVLKKEMERVFSQLPRPKPAYFDTKPIFAKYALQIPIPFNESTYDTETNNTKISIVKDENQNSTSKTKLLESTEYADLKYQKFENDHVKGATIIPFTHLNYALFDKYIHVLGTNNHTASKPYSYSDITAYFDYEAALNRLKKNKNSWWGKKLWNENLITIKGDQYWFTLDPIVNFSFGRATKSQSTFVNTRGVRITGLIGKQISFSSSIFESQGRFADYYNVFAESIRPSGGNPALIPGIGIAKRFKDDAYDFPLAEAEVKYTPSNFFDLQLGYGRNFIGDGYRSIILGDAASPYPYFKINTKFWKIKYTNTFLWLKDIRDEVTVDGTYASKFMANHYLSWNVSKRLNLGFFESVVWYDSNNRGFDANFINPIIFYRAVEFNSSSKSGNALLGLTGKYKWSNAIHLYSQFLIDEFSIGDVREGNKSWRNKFGFQLGAKYFDAFSIENLTLQLEYNQVRPYVYAHSNVLTNYGHNNQSMGHNWGANFRELIAIATYQKERYYAQAKLIYGQRGFDFEDSSTANNYGGNIYYNYNDDRPFDENVTLAQGNKTKVLIADVNAGYIINPSTNLKVFMNFIYRSFDPLVQETNIKTNNTTWLTIGVKTDLFNWYFDY